MIPEAAARLSRRSVVAAAAVAVSTACSAGGDGSSDSAAGPPSLPEPGVAERAQAARDSSDLIRRYDAVATVHPSLAGRLRPLRAEVARHVEAFGGRPPAASAPAGAGTVPGTPAAALADLAGAERALADRRAAVLLTVPGETARLMASVAAAGAGHVALLGAGTGA